MHDAELAERVITVESKLVARTDIGLQGGRARERTAELAARIRDLPSARSLQRSEVDRCPVCPEELRCLNQLAVVPGAAGFDAEPAREASHERGLEAAHPVIAAVDE